MFWKGEPDKEKKNLYHPVISVERPGGTLEKIPFKSPSGIGGCPSWIISLNRLRMVDSQSPV